MVLMVYFSSRISPFTSTVIFFERSPLATAVVTSAMLRTWPVRFAAMRLTLSVRSFQVPATPFTLAWPPSLPSEPTSRATRVTSRGEGAELADHGVHDLADAQELAPQRPAVDLELHGLARSPLATAPMTRATSVVGCTRSPIIEFTESMQSLQRRVARRQLAALADLAFLADHLGDAVELAGEALVQLGDVVEGSAISPSSPVRDPGQRDGEVAVAERAQGFEQQLEIKLRGRRVAVCRHVFPVSV